MINILIAMAVLIALGAVWRARPFGGLGADSTRSALTGLVYYYLLPALVLEVLWAGDIGADSLRVAVIAATIVIVGMILGRIAAGLLAAPAAVTGAMILAAAYPNAIYLGLPVLDTVLGPEARVIAIQFDYLACTPLLLTAGVAIAQHYGSRSGDRESPIWRLVRVPPLVAAAIGILLSLAGVPLPGWLAHVLSMMGAAVIPLMLIALGMSLSWRSISPASLRWMVPVLLIQLAILPLIALAMTGPLGLSGIHRAGAVLEAAMPAMVIGIVLCDRYGLDSGFYSMVVTISTVLSLATLPIWLLILGIGL